MAQASGSPPLELTWSVEAQSTPLTARFGHSLALVPSPSGPKVYAVGGAEVPPSHFAEALDPSLSAWSPVPVPPSVQPEKGRVGHACAVVDSTILIIGGCVDGSPTSDVIALDTASGSWTIPALSGPAPAPRSHHTATPVANLIYVYGGKGASEEALGDVWVLDWAAKAWVSPTVLGPAAPPARFSHTASLLQDQQRILVFGGLPSSDSSALPSSDAWLLEVDTAFAQSSSKAGGAAVAWSEGRQGAPPRPVVICGPSGVGKGTLISKLMGEFPDHCGFSVSHTTRKPRPGEVDGIHYNFSTRSAMEKEIEEGKFLEKADVHGNLYGTSVGAVNKVTASGKMCILDIDVQGAQQVKKHPSISALFVFVAPPSFDELERRLRGRGTETEEQVQKRLKNAKAELEKGEDKELFQHRIVNDDLQAAYSTLKEILGLSKEESDEDGSNSILPRHSHASATLGSLLLLHGGISTSASEHPSVSLLDAALLSGGAPGLTWGLRLPHILPPALSFWNSLLAMFGAGTEPDGDADPAPPRFSHHAVALGASDALLVGGFSSAVGTAISDTVLLSVAPT